jgi:hypothetical protein
VIPLFLGLTIFNLLCLCLTAALGYAVMFRGPAWGTYHQLAGILSTIGGCAVHCIVFTYFVATAKWVLHAIELKQLDPTLALPTRSFKALAFPAALLGMTSTFVAAVAGAATFSYGIAPMWHHLLALGAVAINAGVAVVEYRSIARNAHLIDQVLALVNREAAPVPGTRGGRPPMRT